MSELEDPHPRNEPTQTNTRYSGIVAQTQVKRLSKVIKPFYISTHQSHTQNPPVHIPHDLGQCALSEEGLCLHLTLPHHIYLSILLIVEQEDVVVHPIWVRIPPLSPAVDRARQRLLVQKHVLVCAESHRIQHQWRARRQWHLNGGLGKGWA